VAAPPVHRAVRVRHARVYRRHRHPLVHALLQVLLLQIALREHPRGAVDRRSTGRS
jgi:hypothetical protein